MQRRLLIRLTILILASVLLLSLPCLALGDELLKIKEKAEDTLDKLNPQSLLDLITSNVLSYSKTLFNSFGICLSVIIISSLFQTIKSGLGKGENMFELISCCIVITVVYLPLTACFENVTEHIEAICGFMVSLIPTCVMLHTATGNTLSASLMSTTTSAVITFMQTFSVSLIIPIIKASLSVATANTVCKNTNLSGVAQTLKNISLWILGLSFTLFTGFLSLQSIIQAGGDNLAMKGLKFGAARLIPIAGGLVSESMKTVVTSVGYIKSITGISGIVFIIYAVIPPLCFILLTKLYIACLSMASNLTEAGLISSFLKFTESTINALLALLLSCSVSLIIILSIFIKTTVSI